MTKHVGPWGARVDQGMSAWSGAHRYARPPSRVGLARGAVRFGRGHAWPPSGTDTRGSVDPLVHHLNQPTSQPTEPKACAPDQASLMLARGTKHECTHVSWPPPHDPSRSNTMRTRASQPPPCSPSRPTMHDSAILRFSVIFDKTSTTFQFGLVILLHRYCSAQSFLL
jgi:hypothetical protein